MSTGPFDLSKTPIHLGGADIAFALEDFNFDGESFERYINEHCSDNPGYLMMVETTPTDWASWERHPLGAEIVFVLSGKGIFYQQTEAGEVAIPFAAGTALINPIGVWHSADVTDSMTAIYITPCPETEHKPRTA